MFKSFLPKIVKEAHAAAKADMAWVRANDPRGIKPYAYFLGLQMRNGYAEARIAVTGTAPAFNLPAERWY